MCRSDKVVVRRREKKIKKFLESDTNKKPKIIFIPLMCALQVFIHYGKTEDFDNHLQSDPMRRHEIWRLVTTCFIHDNDGGYHLWENICLQFLFGYPVESVLKWKLTAAVYFISVLFGSLMESSLNACFVPSLGASDAIFGLISLCAFGRLLINRNFVGGIVRLLAFILLLLTAFVIPVKALVAVAIEMEPKIATYLPDIINISHIAHFGGALGGFAAGVNGLHLYLSPSKRGGWILQLRRITLCLTVLFMVATVTYNIHYFSTLKKFKAVEIGGGDEMATFSYERNPYKHCQHAWREVNKRNL